MLACLLDLVDQSVAWVSHRALGVETRAPCTLKRALRVALCGQGRPTDVRPAKSGASFRLHSMRPHPAHAQHPVSYWPVHRWPSAASGSSSNHRRQFQLRRISHQVTADPRAKCAVERSLDLRRFLQFRLGSWNLPLSRCTTPSN